jgi:hypothetical protein
MESNKQKSEEPFVTYLKNEIQQRQSKNPQLTLRSFSKFLEIDPSLFYKILKGERYPTTSQLIKFSEKLKLSKKEFLETYDKTNLVNRAKNDGYIILSSDQISKMNHWLHSYILYCINSNSDKYSSIDVLAENSGQPKKLIKEKLDDLVNLGIVNIKNSKKWHCNPYHYGFGDLKTSPVEVIKSLHDYNYSLTTQIYQCGIQNLNDQRLAKARMWEISEKDYQNIKKELTLVMKKLDLLTQQDSIESKKSTAKKRIYGFQLSLGPLFLD